MKNTRFIFGAIFLLLLVGEVGRLRAERGIASYYHNRFHGRRTASGALYHRDSLTCAHRRYPFGTWLKVTNIRNGKSCIVKVNDRGPYSKRYTIDLSRAAAEQIGIIAAGFAPVEITQVSSHDGVIIPFKLENKEEELVDIELDFVPAPLYPFPDWQADSIPPTAPQP